MAPIDLYRKLKTYYTHHEEQKPLLTTTSATILSALPCTESDQADFAFDPRQLGTSMTNQTCSEDQSRNRPTTWHKLILLAQVFFVVIYVAPFYLSSKTRPSATLNRDNPSVIRARVRFVNSSVVFSVLATFYLLYVASGQGLGSSLHCLGLYPIDPVNISKSLLLTLVLYLGPLYESICVSKDLSPFSQIPHQVRASLASWLGYRNYIVGPVTEEFLFRSTIVTLHLLAHVSSAKITLLTPLYFGIAHVHHFYEFLLTHPDTPWVMALLRSLFHVTYTTIFGWFATFVYLRIGNVYATILIHAYCNYMGLPRLWGKLSVYRESNSNFIPTRSHDNLNAAIRGQSIYTYSLGHTVVYYILLFVGVFGFYKLLFPLTESSAALASFGK